MHDPMVVALEVHVPIPRRVRWRDPKPGEQRWVLRRRRYTKPDAAGAARYPWWRPCGWVVAVAGRAYSWRLLLTIWHVEPGGRDSGSVCPHYVRWTDEHGHPQGRHTKAWRWHVHHWRIQCPPLQALRRRLLTRCAWCGGRDRKGSPVNCSLSWDGPRGRWWQGEPGLYHSGCSTMPTTRTRCACRDPLAYRDGDPCLDCGKRWWQWTDGPTDDADTVRRKYAYLASLPDGARPPRWDDIPVEVA